MRRHRLHFPGEDKGKHQPPFLEKGDTSIKGSLRH
jgi:hypothetical protein